MQYADYLKSNHWKRLRAKKHPKARTCPICGSTSRLEVHHLNYKNLFDVGTADLRVLCRQCHQFAHDLVKAGKLSFESADPGHRWAKTDWHIKANFRLSRPRPRLADGVVTLEWVRWFAGPGGGWTKTQLAALGVPWPPPSGWLRKFAGRQISEEQITAFERETITEDLSLGSETEA